PIQLGIEYHVKLTRHLARHWQFVFIVTEYDKFPNQLRKRRTIVSLELIYLADIANNVREFTPHTVDRIGLFAGAVDRAPQHPELVFNEPLQHLRPDLVKMGVSLEFDAALVRQFEYAQ